ncbi:hypothetical protein Prum_033540 [Phytohabitans rumicis]|uniref:Nudix hydrolase domain-containing protein n=1 Tax=Phytohabitans rumicis TaxID=1076125 RepID=A0A6V8KXA3_9ACTN|nr:hypothetical protein Prum_033540 [Phytohabitans rumicis]
MLLTRASASADLPGVWQVPGGGVDHGEHPAEAVVREFAEETGLTVVVTGLRTVVSDVLWTKHTDRVIYDVAVRNGALRDEPDGTTDLAAWIAPEELPDLPMMPFTAELFDVPVEPVTAPPLVAPPPVTGPITRGQRFAAYGLVTDPDGHVLLTLIAEGYPGAGKWHLPGGGTDHGEQPATALLRELAEESDQVGRVTELLDVTHRHNPRALGPEGYVIDWHAVRATYRVRVDAPTEPAVTEAGGSTAQARWFSLAEAVDLPLTDVAAAALSRLMTGLDTPG